MKVVIPLLVEYDYEILYTPGKIYKMTIHFPVPKFTTSKNVCASKQKSLPILKPTEKQQEPVIEQERDYEILVVESNTVVIRFERNCLIDFLNSIASANNY